MMHLCAESPEDAEYEDQEKPHPSDPSGGAAGNRRNPPGGRSTLILGWGHFLLFVFFFSFLFFLFLNFIQTLFYFLKIKRKTTHLHCRHALPPHQPVVPSPSSSPSSQTVQPSPHPALHPVFWIIFFYWNMKTVDKCTLCIALLLFLLLLHHLLLHPTSTPAVRLPACSISARPVVHRACWERHDVLACPLFLPHCKW